MNNASRQNNLFFYNYVYYWTRNQNAIPARNSSGGLLHRALQSRIQLAGSGVVVRISENFPRYHGRRTKLTFLTINEFPRSPRPNWISCYFFA